MEFALSEEQEALLVTAREWAADETQPTARKSDDPDFDEQARFVQSWRQLAELGFLGILVPAEHGGAGGSLLDAILVAQELSARLITIPYSGTAILAVGAASLVTDGDQRGQMLAEIAAGERVVSLLLDRQLRWPPRGAEGIAWEWRSGARILAPDGEGLAPSSEFAAEPIECEDPSRSLAVVRGDWRPLYLSNPAASERFLATALVATTAALVGYMTASIELAVAHARNREQFGKPIGAFQAIGHLCAEMLVDLESSRTALYGAAWAVDNLPPAVSIRSAAIARAWACAAAKRLCESTIQIHGGMGFTWECDAHLYLRAVTLAADAFGGERGALDIVANHVFGSPGQPHHSDVAQERQGR
jgi:alkylation response protein AidB-like acyl-CoA dehydrogenase